MLRDGPSSVVVRTILDTLLNLAGYRSLLPQPRLTNEAEVLAERP